MPTLHHPTLLAHQIRNALAEWTDQTATAVDQNYAVQIPHLLKGRGGGGGERRKLGERSSNTGCTLQLKTLREEGGGEYCLFCTIPNTS